MGGDYLKKPTDDLESLTIDEFHDWAVIVKKGGANVYMLKGKRHYTELELIGHLDCGTVCFVELWNVHGNLGTYYKAFDKTGKVIGFVRWDDLEWCDRNRLNAGVRKLASKTGIHFSKIWNELYKNLQYKYSICLKQRGRTPYIQWIDEDEWKDVLKVFCAMCEAYKQSPTEMFQQTVPKENLHNAS